MSAVIVPYRELGSEAKVLEELKSIFFESSTKKEFRDEKEKESFFHKYLGWYLIHYPEFAWVAWEKEVLGYVVASPESAIPELFKLQPHLEIFSGEFQKFPAHLHINCHHNSRGRGLGKKLINEVEYSLKNIHSQGLHIMTSPDAQNRIFYSRLGFDFELQLSFQGAPILFMGKSL